MKKVLLSCVLLLSTLLTFAGDEVKLVAGSVKDLRDAEATIEFAVDYSETKVEEKSLNEYLRSRGADFVKDWPANSKDAREFFVVRYNKKNKKFAQISESDAAKAKYKMVLHVKTMDTGNGGGMFIPMASSKAGGVIVNGSVDVAEKATGRPVCKFALKDAKGMSHVSETKRIGLCYFEIASDIAKIIKKSEEDLPISAKDVNVGLGGKSSAKKGSAASKKKAAKKNTGTARKGATVKRPVQRTNARK